MKKIVFIVICAIVFSSCGSSKPCGLASKTKQTKQKHQPVSAVTVVTEP